LDLDSDAGEDARMDSDTSISRGRLEHAEGLLREVLIRDYDCESTGDGGSLGRILIHIVNMHRAVSTSTDEHQNVAKRLGDFALALGRVKPQTPDSAARLTRLAGALQSARSGLEKNSG
jgi:hypothetical protein